MTAEDYVLIERKMLEQLLHELQIQENYIQKLRQRIIDAIQEGTKAGNGGEKDDQ